MTKAMIDEIVGAYANAAAQCAEWGMDGVEVHAAHGYLPAQFLTPALNRRDDDYGGTFENRMRFLAEVLEAVRKAVPKGYPVGIRVAPDGIANGLDVAETCRIVGYAEERSLIDFVNISQGNYQTAPKMIGGMHEPAGYEMDLSRQVSQATTLPTIVTGRFRTLEEAEQVIRSGEATMVSFVRALIADPAMVTKTLAGFPEQVRPCIACNQGCSARLFEPPFRMGCAINAGVGFEASLGDGRIMPSEQAKRVLVVGGGPAGMEAARVAALRGHRVTLVEAAPDLGGALAIAARAPTRHGLIDLVTWLQQEIYRLGVSVSLSTYYDAEDVSADDWDAVIVATGSMPRVDGMQLSHPGLPIKGIEKPHVHSSHDVMTAPNGHFGETAVVIDETGHYEAIAVSEFLVEKGLDVTLVTRHAAIGPAIQNAWMVEPALRRLSRRFTSLTRTRVIEIAENKITVAPTHLPDDSNNLSEVLADTVVFVSPNEGNRDLYNALQGHVSELRIVGDANSPRHLPTAMREGHVAGLRI
jgi:thioredoxin reductase